MDHTYFQEKLSAYLDQELPPDEHKVVKEHITGCEECAGRLAELERLSDFIDQSSGLGESDYWEKSASRIEASLTSAQTPVTDIRPKRAGLYSGIWWKLPAVAASVLIVGYIGLHESDIIQDDLVVPPQEQVDAEARRNEPLETTESTETTGGKNTTESDQPAMMDVETVLIDPAGPTIPVETKSESVPADEVVSRPTGGEAAVPTASPVAGFREVEPEVVQKTKAAPAIALGREESNASDLSPEATMPATESGYLTPDLKSGLIQQESEKPQSSKSKTVLADREPPAEVVIESVEALAVPPAPPPKLPSTEVSSEERPQIKSLLQEGISSFDGGSIQKSAPAERPDSRRLAEWRQQRDSLVAVLDSLGTATRTGPGVQSYAAPKSKRRDELATSGASASDSISRDQVEADLLDIWYDICTVTEDSTELDQGKEYLRVVAGNQKSKLRDKARQYLELLGR